MICTHFSEKEFSNIDVNTCIAIIEYGATPKIGANIIQNIFYLFVQIEISDKSNYAEIWNSSKKIFFERTTDMMISNNGVDFFIGFSIDCQNLDMEKTSRAIYDQIFTVTNRLNLNIVRIWNMIPNIIARKGDGESYKKFCYGRAQSFAQHKAIYPAATGVGIGGKHVCVYLIATTNKQVVSLENPRQTPAYKYPSKYGMKPPSFARATYCRHQLSRSILFVSGTASIIGSETVHVDDVANQTTTTLDNIALLTSPNNLKNYGITEKFDAKTLDFIKVYVKRRADLSTVMNICQNFFKSKNILFMVNDLCRSNLLVEIEGFICSS